MSSSPYDTVRSRGDQFASRIETKITKEVPCEHNPYLAKELRIHGYHHLDLLEKLAFSDVIYLLFKGDLPNLDERDVFRKLLIALINPGPRHPATQAGITAAVSKAVTVNILPIALSVYGGEFDGASGVEDAIQYYRNASAKTAKEIVESMSVDNNKVVIPGFGTLYSDIDPYAEKLLQQFVELRPRKIVSWVSELNQYCKTHGVGILKSGVCAAVMADLGFQAHVGDCLMQLMAAPGLLAHAIEFADKPLTSMSFEPDDSYEIEYEAI